MVLYTHPKISVSLLTAFFFFSILFSGISSAATISVENVSDSVTAADLVNILLGDNSNVSVSNISITGSNAAIGNFTNGDSLGFDTGVVMSTGLISNISNDMSNFANNNNSQPGDSDLSTLVNDTTFDAIILEFDFVPEKSGINFNYRFSSEESFIDVYDDAFGLFVNGENIALLPNGNPVSVLNIGNGSYYEPGPLNNCFNGSSIILTATEEVVPDTLNHMKFAIADARDGVYDSGVFIEGGSFVSNTIPNVPASPLCEGETNPTDITDLAPEFSWTFSDPDDGDTQGAYQIQVGTSENGSDMWDSGQVSSSSSTDISYAGSNLNYDTTYYWRVKTWDNNNAVSSYCAAQTFSTTEEILSPVANLTSNVTSGTVPLPVSFTDLSTNDPTGWAWYFGDEDFSQPWTMVNDTSERWSTRSGHSSVILPDGSIVIMGGYDGSWKNDVWKSTDNGTTWTEVNSSAGWSARRHHSSVVLPDGSIVLMGGASIGYKNDVWRSIDNGATWTEVNPSAGWLARYSHSSVVLPDGSIVLMGGASGGGYKNDVWRSTDNGATWAEINSSSGWSARHVHSSVVLRDGSIVLMGGHDGNVKNDVWRSTDNGATWTEVNPSAGWSGRYAHSSVVLPDGSIVLMGGGGAGYKNDVWRSTDNGSTWTEVNPSAGWSARSYQSSVVLPDGSIVLMGGDDGSYKNDVWRLTTTGSSQQNPSHTYTEAGTYQVTLQAYNTAGYNSTIQTDYIAVADAPVATTVNASYTSVAYTENDNITVDSGINVTGSSTFASARVYIGDGYVEGEDFLRFTNTSNITGSFNSLTGILSLSGSGNATTYQEAFRNVRYENTNDDPNTSDRNITFVMGDNAIYLESTGHYYESIHSESAISWTDAKAAAEARSLSGMQGYLATILSEEESVFLGSKAPDNAWMGANDAAVEGEWRWVAGPENTTGLGTLFYYQGNGTTLPGFYTNWNNNEPNDFEAGEDCGQILGNSDEKKWNDLPNAANVSYYLVEYGGMPDEPTPQLTVTITVNVNSVNDAPSMPGNFTNPLHVQSVERGSTINVTWGESTDLENDSIVYDLWFYNETWTHIANSLSINSYMFTIPFDNVSEVMLKVYANDSVTNSSENNLTFNLTSITPGISFTANVTSGSVPLTVNFTDLSSHYPTVWEWDFGDGNTSTDQSPIHTYYGPGNYNVSLNASNLGGYNISIQTAYITATSVPVASFSSNVTSGAAPLSVSFTDLSTNAPTSWLWNFGDGNTSTEQNPNHTYIAAGTYTVSLNATNTAGSNTTTENNYIHAAVAPVSGFSADVTSGAVPLTVEFTDQSTNTPTSWLWNFGDGNTSTEQNPTHTYVAAGSYTVSLNATNAGGSDTTTETNYIRTAVVPVSSFIANVTSGAVPLIVEFTDQSTNTPTSWLWNFGDGQTSTEQNPVHTYASAGTYTISMNATNIGGSDTTTQTEYIHAAVAPVSGFSTDVTSGTVPLTVEFTDQSTNTPTSWLWNFGDGQTSTEQNPIHTYVAAGSYTVSLNATNAGGSDTITETNYILTAVAPASSFIANVTSGTAPLIVEFTDQSTNTPTSWLWNFGDGQTSTEQNPVYTYVTAGTYTVSLNTTNAGGSNTATQANYITVTRRSSSSSSGSSSRSSSIYVSKVNVSESIISEESNVSTNIGSSENSGDQPVQKIQTNDTSEIYSEKRNAESSSNSSIAITGGLLLVTGSLVFVVFRKK